MLYTRCILHLPDSRDGHRISVMSRHTLSDGTTPDERITREQYDEHIPYLGPPPQLIGEYYKRGLSWEAFEQGYKSHIFSHEAARRAAQHIATRALHEPVTLLCIEETAERCHRRLLAEICQHYEPELHVTHRY